MQSLFIFSTLFSVAAAQAQVEERPTCKQHCYFYMVAMHASGDVDYDYKSWCNDDGPQFCKMNTRDCMESCRENLLGKSSKFDCNEVCKYTRAYSSEQQPAQKAVEEKPVEQSVSVEGSKPTTCEANCPMYLVAAYAAGWDNYNHLSWCSIDGPRFCKMHQRDCMSSCRTNLSNGHPKIDCKEVCKFTRPYYSEQKAAQKAVEEKPVERSLNVEGHKPTTCEANCPMYLVAAYGAGWINYNHYDWCAIDGPQFCKMHTRDCMSSCYTNLSHMHPKIDCKEVCKFTRPYYSEQESSAVIV